MMQLTASQRSSRDQQVPDWADGGYGVMADDTDDNVNEPPLAITRIIYHSGSPSWHYPSHGRVSRLLPVGNGRVHIPLPGEASARLVSG